MTGPNEEFWQARYEQGQTGWDRAGPSPQLLRWLDDAQLQPCRIIVPGCGNGWEVGELAKRGFEVVAIDYTQAAVVRASRYCESLGVQAQIIKADVLSYMPTLRFDAIYEQTCLCALHPSLWSDYAAQLGLWLRPSGQLMLLLMQMLRPGASESGLIQGPPYHCDINGMRALFQDTAWCWPDPPYANVPHPNLAHELALVLRRR